MCAIRLQVRFPSPPPAKFPATQLSWQRPSPRDAGEERNTIWAPLSGAPAGDTLTFVVCEHLDEVRFHFAEQPCVFELLAVTLIVPHQQADVPHWTELSVDGAAILDNDRPGYSWTGHGWLSYDGPPSGYGGTLRYAFKGRGANRSSWEVAELPAGSYAVQATWTEAPDRAPVATYRLYDNDRLVAAVTVDQRQQPAGPAVQGSAFQELATIPVRSGRLRVELDDKAGGIVVADAVRVVRAD